MIKTYFNIHTTEGVVKLSLSEGDVLTGTWLEFDSDLTEPREIHIQKIEDKMVSFNIEGNNYKTSFTKFEKDEFYSYRDLKVKQC